MVHDIFEEGGLEMTLLFLLTSHLPELHRIPNIFVGEPEMVAFLCAKEKERASGEHTVFPLLQYVNTSELCI